MRIIVLLAFTAAAYAVPVEINRRLRACSCLSCANPQTQKLLKRATVTELHINLAGAPNSKELNEMIGEINKVFSVPEKVE